MWTRGRPARSSKTADRSRHGINPAPITGRQLRTLAAAVFREVSWGLPTVATEVGRWRRLAEAIPDASIRADALSALSRKRGQTDGAALFSILPRRRHTPLLRLLVAYQVMWDFLDSVDEHGAAAGAINGLQLHTALVDALDPSREPADYYRHHPWSNDGGYLRALVDACRDDASRLPGFSQIQPLLMVEATRAQVLALNHELDPAARDRSLRAWARREFPRGHEARWWELSGAASAGLTIFALLALAADGETASDVIARTRSVYFPWTAAAATMLDSYVDQVEDQATGDHSYVEHYATHAAAVRRTADLVQRSLLEARHLPKCDAHRLIAACMVAMYLSKDSARTRAMENQTRQIVNAGGSLTRVLIPILRLWRIAYSQRST
jgi:tetraprenyl-beta-curcumene synthase